MHIPTLASRLAALFLCLAVLGAGSPWQDDLLSRVELGLEAADAEAVLTDAPARVEIVLFGQGGMFRRAQAIHVLEDFFRRYPPDGVSFSEPSSSDDGQSATGRYRLRTGGAALNVRVLHRLDGEEWELASIRIDQRPVVRTSGL